jgi:hypothetical protein
MGVPSRRFRGLDEAGWKRKRRKIDALEIFGSFASTTEGSPLFALGHVCN